MNKQYLSACQNDDVLIVNELLQAMNRHLRASRDVNVYFFIQIFANFLYSHLGINSMKVAELLSPQQDRVLVLKLFSSYQNNTEETEWTMACPAPSVRISLKLIRLKLHEQRSEALPASGRALFAELKTILQKNWQANTTTTLRLKDTGLDFTQAASTSMRLVTEHRVVQVELPNKFKPLEDFLEQNKNPAGPILEIFRHYFFQQINCNLTSIRQGNCVKQRVIMRDDTLSFIFQTDIVDTNRNNLMVGTLHLVFHLRQEGDHLIALLDEENSAVVDLLVEYQWRFVKVLHVGSIDIDGTLIHGGTDATHDTPQRIMEANTDIQRWAKHLKISKILSGSNRQSIVKENTNRASRAQASLYAGSSVLLLEELAQSVNAEFDGVMMSDVSNHLPPGTHCHYMYTEEIEHGKREAPKHFVDPLGDEYKIVLMRLQTQYLANLCQDNPHLEIVLHFLDDMPNILKTLTGFYQHHSALLVKSVSLQLWQREVNSIKQCGDLIKGSGLRDANYLQSLLYMQNFSRESYLNYLYESIKDGIDVVGSLNHQIATRIVAESLDQPPLGLELAYLSAGQPATYQPCKAAFAVTEKGPAGYNANGFMRFCLRLQLRNSLMQHGFARENIDLNLKPGSDNVWEILKEKFTLQYSATAAAEKICVCVADTFCLQDPQSYVTIHKQNGFLAAYTILIDFDKILHTLLSGPNAQENLQEDSIESFIRNFW